MVMILAKRKEVIKMEDIFLKNIREEYKYVCKIERNDKEYLLTVPDFPKISVKESNIQSAIQKIEDEIYRQVQKGNIPKATRLCDLYISGCCYIYVKVDKPK